MESVTLDRRRELLERFDGEWLAVSDDWLRVYAHGSSYLEVFESALQAGAKDPIITRLL